MCFPTAQLWSAGLGNALQSPGLGLEALEEKDTGCLKELLLSDGVAKYPSCFPSRAPRYQHGRQVGNRGGCLAPVRGEVHGWVILTDGNGLTVHQ